MIKGTARYNLLHNEKLEKEPDCSKMINGQGLGIVSQMRYGRFFMNRNGCENIAIYNALVYLGLSHTLSEITFFMERYKIMFGVFGCNPLKIGKGLRRYGAVFERSANPQNADAFIISFWTGKRFFSQLHTVFCVNEKDGLAVYNRYNNVSEVCRYKSYHEFIEKRKIITAYIFK